jgi:hypothetical protein
MTSSYTSDTLSDQRLFGSVRVYPEGFMINVAKLTGMFPQATVYFRRAGEL